MNMNQDTMTDIVGLKRTIVELAQKLDKVDEQLKMSMFDQRKMEVDMKLRHEAIERLLERRIKSEIYELSQQHEKDIQKCDKEQAIIQGKMDNVLATINDNLLQKQQVHQWIADEVTKEGDNKHQDLERAVMDTIRNQVQKAQATLQKTLYDEIMGRSALSAMETEVKLTDFMNVKTKVHREQLEQQMTTMITKTLEQEENAHHNKVDKYVAGAIADSIGKLKEALSKHFIEAQKARMEVHKKELGDLLQEEVNDILEEHKRMLTRSLTREIRDIIKKQEAELLKVIEITSNKSQKEVLKTLRQDMLKTFQQHKAEWQRASNATLQDLTTKHKEQLEAYLDGQMQTRTTELQALLSDEFDAEIQQMSNEIEEQHRKWAETKQEVHDLDSRYFAKVPFLLERYSTEFVWHLESFNQMVDDLQSKRIPDFKSDIFYTNGDGLEMQARIVLHGKDLYVKTNFLGDATHLEAQLKCQPNYYHRRTIQLLNQIEPCTSRNRIRIQEPGFGLWDARSMAQGDYDGARIFEPLNGQHRDQGFVTNNTAVVRILIEPLYILYKSPMANHGILFWRIENFSRLKQDERDGLRECTYSDYFYSSVNGYRLQLVVYLKTTHLTFFLRFLHGEWDDFLPQRFPHTSTVTILDQTDSANKEHLSKTLASTTTDVDVWRRFAPHHQIQNPMYYKDDTILVRVQVEPSSEGSCSWVADDEE